MPDDRIRISALPPATTPSGTDVLAGVQSGTTKKFSLSTILSYIQTALTSKFVPQTRKINNKALSADITLTNSDVGAQATITANGILKGDGAGGVSAAVEGTDYGTYSKPSGGIPASDLASGVIPAASTSNPAMDGTAAPGSSTAWARGDHVHPSDDTKANQAQLAYVESGTTASRAYAVGEYFCWNGLLYRATAAISSAGDINPGANCTAVTEGGLNSLRSVTVNTLSIEATSYITNINQCHAYTVGKTAYVFISCQIAATPEALINLIKGIPRPYNNTQIPFFAVTSSGATFVLVVNVENGVAYIRKGSNNASTAGWYTGTVSYPIA